ncbi:acyl-coenzyme A synthetase ACSM1, mitochondrial isoform X1 [Homo sapiens]|uniref:acyl-coenzyme A synthetase ACSM1, mitochondrial isoform X1 n=1 Tax=Homo sapiens TaxID=9606 RepID=UPI0003EB024F|nr:acyl-coenzyme A synthetase ACSM1, mitochondrial isoform X1 [Homo sapiens]XP_054235498.1 acyl-coenzyme A synthetase ACSM1, mitochondrial isoform X1 [Homo sapiens]|eukprot:XP_006721079.1 acyl-coenzyme A synthetase ACSM1, mitochondrial isoform X1 [Homo sapiens]
MQWLMRFRTLWGIHKSFHNIHPAPSQLRCRSLSEFGAPRWNDYEVPEEFNFASYVLDYWAQKEKEGKRGPNPAFWWVNGQGDEVKWSFREMGDLTRRVANVFTQTCGLQQGDHLALMLPRVPEWWLVAVGCMRTGIIFIPATILLKAKDILYRLQLSKAKGIVTIDALASEVDSIASQCPSLKTKLLVSDHSREGWLDFRSLVKSASPEHTCVKSKTLDPMVIFFTSGTTGFPKMAKHSHGLALQPSFPGSRKLRSLKTSDVSWCLSDSGWIVATIWTLVEPWTAGCTVFIHHLPQFDTKVIIQTLLKYPINHFWGVSSIYRMILQQDFTSIRFPALEHCYTGGEVVLPKDQEEWKRRTGLLLYENYGQSETGLICATYWGMKIKPGFMGKATPPYDVQGDPEKTAKVECGDFYNTGDRGKMDEEGYICFLGRSDDIINASGYRIGPAEVESALVEHPAVAESAVVGSPDPIRGEVVKAFIVLTPQFLSHDKDQLTKELQQHVKSVTAPYKYPRKVEFVSELPKTITGKIERKELRKKETGQM